jgi:2-keto-4-pentenoate hydratase
MTNGNTTALSELQAIAAEAFAVLDTGHQISPFSARFSAFDLDEAYRVTAAIRQMREMRGEMPVGRKIGFTNRTIWAEYNVYGPVWGYVYDRTVHNLAEIGDTFSLVGLAEPRIEPEIVFKLALAPAPDMDETALLACIDWVAHGFEIVQSIFPDWKFSAPDTVAAFGLHGALLIGAFNRSARRGLEPDAFNLRDRSEARRHGRRSRSRYERVGWTCVGTASSRRYSRGRSGQSAARSRRDHHDGNADACTSAVRRSDMDDRTHGCRA